MSYINARLWKCENNNDEFQIKKDKAPISQKSAVPTQRRITVKVKIALKYTHTLGTKKPLMEPRRATRRRGGVRADFHSGFAFTGTQTGFEVRVLHRNG